MRFVSHVRSFGVQFRAPKVRFTNYGDRIVDDDGYDCRFAPDVTQADVDFAERTFAFNGRTLMLDEVTLTPIINRLSVFDTDEVAARENWEPQFKADVEAFLLERSQNHPDFAFCEQESILPPWPTYDDFNGTVPQLVEKIRADGFRFQDVLLYELRKQNRDNVVEALEAAMIEEQNETADAPMVSA